jgi:hypothetical protein
MFKLFKKKAEKGQSVMGILGIVIAGVLSIIIAQAFITAGNFSGTLSTLADTIPLILMGIVIFAGVAAFGILNR